MSLDIVILGPPGAGKGTQGQRISEELGIPHINTGDMYRAAVAAGSALGEKVHPYLERGELVPDDLTIDVVRHRLAQPDTAEGFVLDGFPRTLPQAEALDRRGLRRGAERVAGRSDSDRVMIIRKSQQEIDAMARAGRVVADTLGVL